MCVSEAKHTCVLHLNPGPRGSFQPLPSPAWAPAHQVAQTVNQCSKGNSTAVHKAPSTIPSPSVVQIPLMSKGTHHLTHPYLDSTGKSWRRTHHSSLYREAQRLLYFSADLQGWTSQKMHAPSHLQPLARHPVSSSCSPTPKTTLSFSQEVPNL